METTGFYVQQIGAKFYVEGFVGVSPQRMLRRGPYIRHADAEIAADEANRRAWEMRQGRPPVVDALFCGHGVYMGDANPNHPCPACGP